MEFLQILEEAEKRGASDIHIAPGHKILFRAGGRLVPMSDEIVPQNGADGCFRSMLSEAQKERLAADGELDFAYTAGERRIRVSIFRQQGVYAMAIRLVPAVIPTPASLGVPETVLRLTEQKRGIILVTGAAGSGKTTTAASLVNYAASGQERTVVTLESPIEYVYPDGKSMVLQREIGTDSKSYASALSAALKEDFDVVLVGELSDVETVSLALTAAETGRLVFGILHTGSVRSSIERMIEIFPPHKQRQVSVELAGVLLGVVSQQLLPRADGAGMAAAFEALAADEAVRSLIRGQKYGALASAVAAGRTGTAAMDDAIYDLYMKSVISPETAVAYAQDSHGMAKKVELF